MKKIILFFAFFISIKYANTQVIFTYGKHPVSLETLKKSFEKNNPDSAHSKSAFQHYLNLYINFKLKIQAAYDLRMDTLPNQIADRLAFEEQIKPIHFLDATTLEQLVNEAMDHRLNEINLSHIFISYKQPFQSEITTNISKEEIELAERKIDEIQKRISLGESFEELAVAYSNDADVKMNKGNLGYIKAFTLPYAFEKIVFALNDGQISSAIKSEAGIHLFKRNASKKIEGPLSIAQILITVPENAPEIEIKHRESLAQKIYTAATNGENFDSLVALYSEDRSSNNRGGLILNMETGDYDPEFDKQVRSLKSNGQISPLFKTAFGFHILKRNGQDTLNLNLAQLKTETRELVLQDERIGIAKKVFIAKSIGKHGLTADEKDKESFILNQLQNFSQPYAEQISEFKDGNLLFEIMDKKIWSKATGDSEALKAFHAARKQNYQWKNSITVISITTQNKDIAVVIKSDLEKGQSISTIRKLYSEVAFIDSTRQEAGAVLGIGSGNAKNGFISEIIQNESDGTFTFSMVAKVHKDPSVMEFEEARVQVINDYQQVLEENWIKELKKKYPIVINQAVLKKALSTLN